MTEQVVEPVTDESPEGEGTEQVPAPEDTPKTDDATTWRNRYNGQQAALNKAVEERKELAAKLEKFEQAEREAQMAGMTELERLKAEKADAERRAQEAEQKATDKFLDRSFPNARKEFPEIRDEVRLAKLEAAFSAPTPEPEPDATRAMRAPKAASTAPAEPPSSKEIFAGLKGKSWSDVLPGS